MLTGVRSALQMMQRGWQSIRLGFTGHVLVFMSEAVAPRSLNVNIISPRSGCVLALQKPMFASLPWDTWTPGGQNVRCLKQRSHSEGHGGGRLGRLCWEDTPELQAGEREPSLLG